jgi:hypothetical protein
MTNFRVCFFTVLALGGVANLAAAGPSFSGTWKLNLAKSQISGTTFNLEKTPSGKLHFDSEGFGYDFDLTGKEYPTPDGGTTSWKSLDANTWEATNRMSGKVIASYRLVLKGDILMSESKLTKPDGSLVEQNANNTRVSGGPGFFGKWKNTSIAGTPTTLDVLVDSSNRITLNYPEFQQVCSGSFDGKDAVIMSAGVASKQTMAFESTGANSFRVTTKLNGKPLYIDVFTLSPDGKTLTDDGNAVSVSEPVKAIYERQ